MSPDEQALLAAVCAAPADDTPRLVYADWLDENGNPARAEFVRLQVEADRLHPDSNRRGLLEAQAASLFAAHWIDWWGEVCEAVGLPLPERPRQTRFGRLARRVVAGGSVGRPYRRAAFQYDRFDISADHHFPTRAGPSAGLVSAGFRRGFADRLRVGPYAAGLLARWASTGPIAELTPHPTPGGGAPSPDCPHLAHVPRLVLFDPVDDELSMFLHSPHLTALAELRFETTDPPGNFGRELLEVVFSPAAPRLRRLEVPLPDAFSAELLVGAASLAGLTDLHVELEFEPAISGGAAGPFPPECDRQRLETLARSPHLAGLTELYVSGVLSAAGVRALVHRPTWAGLRTLTLDHLTDADYLGGLADAAGLDGLIDLRVTGLLSDDELRLVGRLPILRRLRHLNVWPPYDAADADLLAVSDALDPGRLETLALRYNLPSPAVRAEMVRRFGDRVRFG